MRIAYMAASTCVHGHKWISHFAKHHDVILLCEEDSGDPVLYARSPEVKVLPILPRAYPVRRVLEKRRALSRIRAAIAEHRTEVIHSMYAMPYSLWAHDIGFRNHIVTTRGSDVLVDYKELRQPRGLGARVTAYFLRRALERTLRTACYVTSTSTTQQDAIRHLVAASRLLLVRTGVDVAGFLSVYGGLSAGPKVGHLILSIRGMLPKYNIDLILDAFAVFRQRSGIYARLVTINYPPGQPYLSLIREKIAASPFRDAITILEAQSREGLLQLYRDADLVVMFPRSDGTPVSGVETMLAQKPLLVGPLAYDTELFNPGTVWATKSFAVSELADSMAELLRSSRDTVRTKTDRAFNLAQEHADLQKEVLKIERLYASLSMGRPG